MKNIVKNVMIEGSENVATRLIPKMQLVFTNTFRCIVTVKVVIGIRVWAQWNTHRNSERKGVNVSDMLLKVTWGSIH